MTEAIASLAATPVFEATAAPYAVLDRDLTICAVNGAYEAATGHSRKALLGERIFEAFPANPHDPAANGADRLSESLDFVLARNARHVMGVQRHDVPDAGTPGRFRYKVWTPVNSPIRDDAGRCVGVLHHVEDVTELHPLADEPVASPDGEDGPTAESWRDLLHALKRERELSAHLRQQVGTLREAVETNREIGSAIGLLMAQAGVGPQAAFDLLRAQSARDHRKLREVAHDIVVRYAAESGDR